MNKSTIILVATSAILNSGKIIPYKNLSVNYSVYLNTLLYSNWMEIFESLREQYEIYSILNDLDREYLPKYFLHPMIQHLFFEETEIENLIPLLGKKFSVVNSKTMVLFYNSIGIKPSDFSRIFNLVQTEDPSVVIGKSSGGAVALVCTYGLDKDVFEPLFRFHKNYDIYLNHLSNKDVFVHTLDNFLLVDNFEDIKELYIELSKKESLSYCSQKMHESFNDLFIEYKEILNV